MRKKTEQGGGEIIHRRFRCERMQNGLMTTVDAIKITDGKGDRMRQRRMTLPTVNEHGASRKKRAL